MRALRISLSMRSTCARAARKSSADIRGPRGAPTCHLYLVSLEAYLQHLSPTQTVLKSRPNRLTKRRTSQLPKMSGKSLFVEYFTSSFLRSPSTNHAFCVTLPHAMPEPAYGSLSCYARKFMKLTKSCDHSCRSRLREQRKAQSHVLSTTTKLNRT